MDLSIYLNKLEVRNNRVFDPIRKKWFLIQPEELVRQSLLLYLLEEKKLTPHRIAVEKMIRLHDQIRRFDLVYYDHLGHPLLLVECKSPSIALSQIVLEQAIWYNFEVKAPYLLLSNGKTTAWFLIDPKENNYREIPGNGPDLSNEK